MCLIHGDIVPDNSCNDRGSGVNECCTGNSWYERNENFDFKNSAGKTTAPTLPGSLAAQATTTAYAAPAEFDVTLTTSPGCVFAAGAGVIGTIECTFDTKGGADYYVDSALYSTDCSTGVAPTGVGLDTSNTGFNRAGGDKQYASSYAVTLPIANSAAATGNDLAFCLRTEVKDKDGDVYDWTGQKIKLAINVVGTFTTNSLSTQTFDGDATAEQNVGTSSFGVSIDRCDENGGVISGGGTVLTVGENFYLCVKGSKSQVVVSNIQQMTASKDSDTLSLVAATVSNSNTFVYGNGQNQVVIATRLPATFFASGGAVTFSGSANIVVGARRRLSRSMQVASVSSEESANFSMDIQVAGMDDASSASAIKTTAAMFFAAAVAALFV